MGVDEDLEAIDYGDEIRTVTGSVTSPKDRIAQLQGEIDKLRGGTKPNQLAGVFQNPSSLIQQLSITEKQAKNLKSLVVGGGTGAIHRLLSQYFGDIPAAMMGAALSGWLAGKFFRSQ